MNTQQDTSIESKQSELLELLSSKSNIIQILHQNKALLEQLHKINNLPSMEVVIKFAENITPNSHAPLKWKSGFPLFGCHPPQPLFEEMRCGALETYNSAIKKSMFHQVKVESELVNSTRKRVRDSSVES